MPGRALFGGLFAGGILWTLIGCGLALRGTSPPQEILLVTAGAVFSGAAGAFILASRPAQQPRRPFGPFLLGFALALAAAFATSKIVPNPPARVTGPVSPPASHPADRFERPATASPVSYPVRLGAELQLARQTRRVRGSRGRPFRAAVAGDAVRVMFGAAPKADGGRVVVEWLGSPPRILWSGAFTAAEGGARWEDVTLDLPPGSGTLEIRVEQGEGAGADGESDVFISEPAFLRSTEGMQPVNLILVSIDTLRADMLGTYGYERFPTSPSLDRLAARGTVFENVFAPSPWTKPSHMALLTGIEPDALGMAKPIGSTPRLSRGRDTLSELFSAAGYLSVAFTGTATIAARHGFSDGFYLQQEAYNDDATLQRDLDTNLHLALDWLGEHRQEPLFLFFHTFEPHNPYVHRRFVTPGLHGDEARSAAYASGIGFTDGQIGTLVERLEEMGLLRSSILVVTSDHGEGLDVMPRLYHGRTLYDDVLRVPLILVGEGIPEAHRVKPQVPLIDLFATLAELYGLEIPDGVDSRSLWPLVTGESEQGRPVHLCCLAHRGQMRGLRQDGYKYTMMPRGDGRFQEELYDLDADPLEEHNLAGSQAGIAGRMRKEVVANTRRNQKRAAEETGSAPRADQEFESQLRALGYVE